MSERKMTLFFRFVRFVFWLFGKVWFRAEVRGVGNIPLHEGAIIASNHASHLDPVIIGGNMPFGCYSFAKAELFSIPVVGWIIRNVYAIPIRRGTVDRESLRTIIDLLKAGEAVVMFPEGTRTLDGELQEAKGGIGMMAYQAGACVVPCYISGTYEAMPRKAKFIWPKKVILTYGQPIYPPTDEQTMQLDKKTRYDRFSALIMQGIAEIKETAQNGS